MYRRMSSLQNSLLNEQVSFLQRPLFNDQAVSLHNFSGNAHFLSIYWAACKGTDFEFNKHSAGKGISNGWGKHRSA